MINFHSNLSFNQDLVMVKSVHSIDPYSKLKQINQIYKKKNNSSVQNQLNIPGCEKSRSAVLDVIILIAVIIACGILLYPSGKLLIITISEIFKEAVDVFKDEILDAPMVYGCFGLSILLALISLLFIVIYISRSCGKPGCRGLSKSAEFDIQLETEECVKISNANAAVVGGGSNHESNNGLLLFQLPRDHHRELEAELKKMAPPNGRAVLVFRARCGCSVGRLEVLGPKKARKVRK